MQKLAFMQKEPLSRLFVAFLLTAGIATPLLLAMDLAANLLFSLLTGAAVLALLTVLNANRRSRRLIWIIAGALLAVQFVLPGMGLLGSWVEAAKALSLYFAGYTVALPVFGNQVASLITALAAVLSFVFAKRGVGFLPAAMVVVLVLFGLWSLGKGNLFWYAAPALVALLLQMSQSAHEKINILHVLPMALAAVLAAFLILPGGRFTVEPLASAARELKQRINDYLFFTEPRNVFTLGTYGYYPMGGNQLGGEAEPSEFPVMIVRTERKTLLRAVVKDNYTGRNFTDTASPKRYLYVNPRWQVQRRDVFLEALPSEAIRKTSHLMDQKAIAIQVQNRTASTVFTPLFLRDLTMTGDMVPYFNDSSELFITRDMQQGDRYTVFTPVFEGGDAGLEALVEASRKGEDRYAAVQAAYTQLPAHLEQKVYDDVQNIVKGADSPYDKAMAIMRHLQKYYRYTLTPETPPANKDFVTYFLYVGKEGYCTYYASAMTVMARMAGLPSRYVEGFVATPGADGLAYVTGKEAHAWTEVYFEGFGWVPFDPTPNQQTGGQQSSGEQSPEPSPSPEPDDQPTPTPEPSTPPENPPPEEPQPSDAPQDEPDQQDDPSPELPPENPNPFPWWLLLVAAALGGLGARIAWRMPDRVAARTKADMDKIFIYGAAVQRLLLFAKRVPQNGETPIAFARRVDSVRVFPTPIAPLWRLMALGNYSRMPLTPDHTLKARETYHAVFKGSHALRKMRFLLAAAFDPRFYRALETPAPHDKPPTPPTFQPKKVRRVNPAAFRREGAATTQQTADASTAHGRAKGKAKLSKARITPDATRKGHAAPRKRDAQTGEGRPQGTPRPAPLPSLDAAKQAAPGTKDTRKPGTPH
ncbi:MAG: transglutaminase domain-containing protein [Candidatus Limiplasma sp.]|nr:transglutaminase domain-containing protein [Candidatus Limiplasma sp.]